MQTLSYFPGQTVTVFLETLDGYGARTNAVSTPTLDRVILPSLLEDSGYPQDMINFDTGLYYYRFTLPSGAVAVGSYLVDMSYINPSTGYVNNQAVQIVVTAPYGQFSITTG